MNNYILLDGKKYYTRAKNWKPEVKVPSSVRIDLDSALDATYGSGVLYVWSGEIKVHVTPPDASFGTADDLRATLTKRSGIAFRDHNYPTTPEYTVHVQGYKERSLSPKWDSPSNAIFFMVTLKGS